MFQSYVCVILEANEGIAALDGIFLNLSALVHMLQAQVTRLVLSFRGYLQFGAVQIRII